MSARKILGIVLLAAGILALAVRTIPYSKETHEAELGPIQFEMKQRKDFEIPVWAGVALAAAGGALLAFNRK